MAGVEVLVGLAAAAAIGLLAWFFFGSRQAGRAVLADGAQEITVVVEGAYSPDLVSVQAGVPATRRPLTMFIPHTNR